LDGDFHMVYYRSDLLAKDNLKPPATWDDYMTIAKKYQGQDLNGDGQPDYGSCIAKKKGAQSYWWIISVAAGLLQSQGTNQGAFFDTKDMTPLFGANEAMTKALDLYKATTTVGPPDELNMDVGGSRGLFTTGRCALTMDWGDIGTLTPGTYAQDKTGATITPGWKEVLDRATGKLVPCDSTTCPNAVDGVNYAPFASFGGWSGAVNAAAPKEQQDAAYAFLSYMSAPAQSSIDVTLGKTGYNPYRTSHFSNLAPWEAAGLSEAAATNYLDAIKTSLQSPNMVLDLRIPLTKRYEQDVLDTSLAQFLANELDEAGTEQAIADGWNGITNDAGKDAQLAAYVASLGVKR
jgi:multiple sugar transport system substrate-binding protein